MSTAVQQTVVMSESEYRAAPGLSNSAMKDLAVSPFRFWYLHVNPNRPGQEPTAEMEIGSALHCAILEPDEFESRYACEITPDDHEDCLVTMDDLRTFLRSKGVTPKGTRKLDVALQVATIDPQAPIFDLLVQAHAEQNAGKIILKKDAWKRVVQAAESLRLEPKLRPILESGAAEVAMFGKDPDTGVTLKARMDWITPKVILDLKTFSQKRGKSIDKSVTEAIWYEQYFRQAFFYSLIRGWPKEWNGDFVMAFVESDEPHEVRIKALRPKYAGQPTLYWQKAMLEVRGLIRTYADYMERFGERPWRDAQEIDPLMDEDMPGLAY